MVFAVVCRLFVPVAVRLSVVCGPFADRFATVLDV
jgi:hypothetical protein